MRPKICRIRVERVLALRRSYRRSSISELTFVQLSCFDNFSNPLHGQLPGRWRILSTSLKSSWSRPIFQTWPLPSSQTKFSTNHSICAPPHLIQPPKTPEPSDACNASAKMRRNIATRNPNPYRQKRNASWVYMISQTIRGNMQSMNLYIGCG